MSRRLRCGRSCRRAIGGSVGGAVAEAAAVQRRQKESRINKMSSRRRNRRKRINRMSSRRRTRRRREDQCWRSSMSCLMNFRRTSGSSCGRS